MHVVKDSKQTILLFLGSLNVGGAQRVAVELCNYWNSLGYSVTLVALSASELKCAFEITKGISVIGLGDSKGPSVLFWKPIRLYRKLKRIRKIIASYESARVISFMTHVNILVLLANLGFRRKLVVSERSFPPLAGYGVTLSVARKVLYPFAHNVAMQTSDGLTWLKENIPRSKGVLIPNPVGQYSDREVNVDPDLLLEKQDLLILSVGRLECEKNFQLLIESFSQSELMKAGWKLVILGEGSERANLESTVHELRLCGHVLLPGSEQNLNVWFERADIFALTSRFEGFPNALLEAMSAGTAVVSVDCKTGPNELIEHGYNGLLVNESTGVEGVAEALRALASDAELRALFAERSSYVNSKFALPLIAAQWIGAFGDN